MNNGDMGYGAWWENTPAWLTAATLGTQAKVGQAKDWFGENPQAGKFAVGAGTAIFGALQQRKMMEQEAAMRAELARQQMAIDAAQAEKTQQLMMFAIPTIAIVVGIIAWSRREK